jgi:hypothetical protein
MTGLIHELPPRTNIGHRNENGQFGPVGDGYIKYVALKEAWKHGSMKLKGY